MSDIVETARELLAMHRPPYMAEAKVITDLIAEVERLEDLTNAQNGYNAQMTDERDAARAEEKGLRAEVALLRDGYNVRPMTEYESNLMTQVLELRRELADLRAEVERLRPRRIETVEGGADE